MSNVSNLVKSIQDIMRKDAGTYGDAPRIEQMAWLFFLKIFDDREKELELLRDDYKSPLPPQLTWSAWAADEEGITGDALLDFVNNTLLPKLKTLTGTDRMHALIRMTFEDANNYMKNGTLMRQVVNRINGIDFNTSTDRHLFGDIYEKILKDLQSAGNAGEFYTPRAVTQFIVDQVNPRLGESILDPACGTGGFLVCAIEHLRKQAKTEADERRIQDCFAGIEKKALPHVLCMTNLLLHGIDVPSNVRHDNTLARPLRDWGPKERVDVIVTNPPFGGMEEDGIEKDTSRLLQRKTFRDSPSKSTKTAFRVGDVLYGKLRPYLNKVLVADAPGYCTTEIIPIRTFGFIDSAYLCYALKRPAFLAYANSKSYGMNLPRLGTGDARLAPVPLPPLAEQKRIVAKVDKLMALCDRLEAQQQEREIRRGELARASLARFADAPTPTNLQFLFHKSYDIAPADLRKSILTLAVQGKLVPQDPNDEPASALLLRFEKYRHDNPGEDGRNSRDASDSAADNTAYQLPAAWTWAKLSTIALRINDGNYGESYPNKSELLEVGIPFLTSASILPDGSIDRTNLKFLSAEKQSKLTKAQIIPGDVIFPNRGARGGQLKGIEPIAIVVPDWLVDGNVNPQVTRIRLHPDFYINHFLCMVLRTPLFLNQFESATGGTALPFINLTKTKAFTVPVPPLAEQRRIVAKVDELMALVDALETQLATARTTATALLEALVAELTAT